MSVKVLTPGKKKLYQAPQTLAIDQNLGQIEKPFRGFVTIDRQRIWFVATY
ncbi:MAG: hypothetical protein LBF49_02545 [Puniceicoccales bacterium]|nr:hypothetical protein [Puniceicoccales bacterium]